jgi:hypothetical protein
MALPSVPADGLARRLNIPYPGGALDSELEATMTVSEGMLTGHVDEALVTLQLGLWAAAVTGLAVKVWDTATKGAVGMDALGGYELPAPSATAGLINAVAALWHPLTVTGGNVIA